MVVKFSSTIIWSTPALIGHTSQHTRQQAKPVHDTRRDARHIACRRLGIDTKMGSPVHFGRRLTCMDLTGSSNLIGV